MTDLKKHTYVWNIRGILRKKIWPNLSHHNLLKNDILKLFFNPALVSTYQPLLWPWRKQSKKSIEYPPISSIHCNFVSCSINIILVQYYVNNLFKYIWINCKQNFHLFFHFCDSWWEFNSVLQHKVNYFNIEFHTEIVSYMS